MSISPLFRWPNSVNHFNRGSLTFWLDDEAIQAWYESATPSSRGRPQRYSDLAITTVLV
ncbi:transposase, partial [Klebsiella pneumoniae]|uniref:transposase n=1 Tax=Klebsiella pneumoniae TaxID=573 RepID=UPI0015742A9D